MLACRHEPALARALGEERWPPELAAHLKRCPRCREATRLVGRLQTMARPSIAAARPQDPVDIWARAALAREVARRRELVRRAARPAVWFHRVAVILATGTIVTWITTARGEIGRAAAALMGDPRALLTRDLPGALGDPWSLGFLGGAILFAAYLWGRAALGQLARP